MMARKYRFVTADLTEAVLGENWVNHHIESLTTTGVLVVINGVKYFFLDALEFKITSKDLEKLEKFIAKNEELLVRNHAIR